MSGIYIKGIEMPKNCEECAIKSWDMEDYVCPFSGISTLCISRQANCPLISVPDHGRLIDADALMSKFAEKVRRSNNSDFAPIPRWNHAVAIVEEMPTIIPADKEET